MYKCTYMYINIHIHMYLKPKTGSHTKNILVSPLTLRQQRVMSTVAKSAPLGSDILRWPALTAKDEETRGLCPYMCPSTCPYICPPKTRRHAVCVLICVLLHVCIHFRVCVLMCVVICVYCSLCAWRERCHLCVCVSRPLSPFLSMQCMYVYV